MKIVIPSKTPTINHLYGQNGSMKYLKPEAKKLRAQISDWCKEASLDPLTTQNNKLSVHVMVYEDWYTKKGDVKRKDIANREKFLIDSVFDALGIDDKMIFKSTFEKVQSIDEEKAVVEICVYQNHSNINSGGSHIKL